MTIQGCQFLNADQLAWIWTGWRPDSIRELARKGKVPVAFWVGREPLFARDIQTVLVMTRLTYGEQCHAA